MLGSRFVDEVERTLVFYATALITGAALMGAFLKWGIPKLWHWIAPIIHGITS